VKRNPNRAKQRRHTLRVWTYAQAQAARPYVASVVSSLREHGLEALAQQQRARALATRPGRPDRDTLIAQQDAERLGREAEDRFQDAVAELQELDIYSLDPLKGLALIPFIHNDQLAWYVFDLFDPQPFRFWRFQTDPEDTRRPVTALQRGSASSTRKA